MAVGTRDDLARRWDEAGTPRELVACLAGIGSLRKFRLAMCAAIRRLWPLALDPRTRQAVEIVERFADGLADAADLTSASPPAYEAYNDSRSLGHEPAVANAAYCVAFQAPPHDPCRVAIAVFEDCRAACERNSHLGFDPRREQEVQAWQMRCVFGHPFHDLNLEIEAWRAWDGGTLPRLARGIYDECRFADLPILADALEEAGCAEPRLLTHCRDDGPHARGCWAVDLLLGKG